MREVPVTLAEAQRWDYNLRVLMMRANIANSEGEGPDSYLHASNAKFAFQALARLREACFHYKAGREVFDAAFVLITCRVYVARNQSRAVKCVPLRARRGAGMQPPLADACRSHAGRIGSANRVVWARPPRTTCARTASTRTRTSFAPTTSPTATTASSGAVTRVRGTSSQEAGQGGAGSCRAASIALRAGLPWPGSGAESPARAIAAARLPPSPVSPFAETRARSPSAPSRRARDRDDRIDRIRHGRRVLAARRGRWLRDVIAAPSAVPDGGSRDATRRPRARQSRC